MDKNIHNIPMQQSDAIELAKRLEFLSYRFITVKDKNDMKDIVQELLPNMTLAVTQILYIKTNRVITSKFYEVVEHMFANQDAYNINRAISALKRWAQVDYIDMDTHYREWLENRIVYGVKFIMAELNPTKIIIPA